MTHWRNGGRLTAGAHHQPSALRANTQRDPYPLPANSILQPSNPFINDRPTKERAALSVAVVFFSLVFVIPLILAGIMMRGH